MDETTPFKLPATTGRNILIFSDGTGQAGGYLFDEARSNVYKLFRATRCGPDSAVDPALQLAFYDPGLGSKGGGATIKFSWFRKVYNVLSGATGLGITRNIVDCYAALIVLWRPGDRIFLFGFSRGAYTVRCLAGVLGLCGIPTRMTDGSALRRGGADVEAMATEAVKRVYAHGSGAGDLLRRRQASEPSRTDVAGHDRMERLRVQRQALGEQFRAKYGSDGPDRSNAVPHFIGVWDTVAAVGLSPPAFRTAVGATVAAALLLAAGVAWLHPVSWGGGYVGWFLGSVLAIMAATLATYYGVRLKWVTGLPGHPWYRTIHLTSFRMRFFDRSLNPHVRYARHAIALDEFRADFDRVEWVNEDKPADREPEEGAWFTQLWFAGDHSDVGGSYPENESRLSDISLGWIADEARRAGMIVDERYLKLFGRADGPQHDECRVGILFAGMRFKWREGHRKIAPGAPVHHTVEERLRGGPVLIFDEERLYRPPLLAKHVSFADLYASSQTSSA